MAPNARISFGFGGFGVEKAFNSSKALRASEEIREDVGQLFSTFARTEVKGALEEFLEESKAFNCPEGFEFRGLPMEVKFMILSHLDHTTVRNVIEATGLPVNPNHVPQHIYTYGHTSRAYRVSLETYKNMKKFTVLIPVQSDIKDQEEFIRKGRVERMRLAHFRRWISFNGAEFFAVEYDVLRK